MALNLKTKASPAFLCLVAFQTWIMRPGFEAQKDPLAGSCVDARIKECSAPWWSSQNCFCSNTVSFKAQVPVEPLHPPKNKAKQTFSSLLFNLFCKTVRKSTAMRRPWLPRTAKRRRNNQFYFLAFFATLWGNLRWDDPGCRELRRGDETTSFIF